MCPHCGVPGHDMAIRRSGSPLTVTQGDVNEGGRSRHDGDELDPGTLPTLDGGLHKGI